MCAKNKKRIVKGISYYIAFFLECERWIITVKPDKYCLKVEKLELPLWVLLKQMVIVISVWAWKPSIHLWFSYVLSIKDYKAMPLFYRVFLYSAHIRKPTSPVPATQTIISHSAYIELCVLTLTYQTQILEVLPI